MSVSTSPENALGRAPDGSWGAVWFGALLVVVVVLAGVDLGWRSTGLSPAMFEPGRTFGEELHRALDAPPERAMVIVGSSRSQLGVDPQLLRRETGMEVFNLALNGGHALAAFEHLANETQYRGHILLEYMPAAYFTRAERQRALSETMIARADDPSPIAGLESSMRLAVTRTLLVGEPSLGGIAVLRTLAAQRRLPGAPTRRMRRDRFVTTDASAVDGEALDRRWARQIERAERLSAEQQEALIADITSARDRIAARGGQTLFFRVPSSGQTAEAEAARFPRASHYDLLRARIGGPWWHFADSAESADVECFDGSHMTGEDARRFSHALAAAWLNHRAPTLRP